MISLIPVRIICKVASYMDVKSSETTLYTLGASRSAFRSITGTCAAASAMYLLSLSVS